MQQEFVGPAGDSGGNDLPGGLHRSLSWAKQSTRANRSIQLLDFGDCPQVETYDYDATLQLVTSDQFDHSRSEFIVLLSRSTCFQFDIDDQLFVRLISEQPEHIVERGDGLPRIFQTRELAIHPIEPTTDVDLLQLVGAGARDPSLAQPSVRHPRIMDHHGHSVARESHVQFNSVSPVAKSPRERSERVFRGDRRGAAMADDKRGFVVSDQSRRNEYAGTGSIWLRITNTLQLNIKVSQINFQLGPHRKMAIVFRDPDR